MKTENDIGEAWIQTAAFDSISDDAGLQEGHAVIATGIVYVALCWLAAERGADPRPNAPDGTAFNTTVMRVARKLKSDRGKVLCALHSLARLGLIEYTAARKGSDEITLRLKRVNSLEAVV